MPKRQLVERPTSRWYHVTPDRFVVGVLALEIVFVLWARFEWFPYCMQKGWPVLIALAIAATAGLVLLLWWGGRMLYGRPFRFSTRSLLLAIVAMVIPCGWLVAEIRQARRQRQARQAIHTTQYSTYYDQVPHELDWPTYWPRMVLGDDFFLTVHEIVFAGPDATDGLLENVKALPQLQVVVIDQASITDAGLVHLTELTRLQELYIKEVPVTDVGLEHLEGLTSLSKLRIYATNVSHMGIAELQQALPNCKIESPASGGF